MTYRLLNQLDNIIDEATTERPFLGWNDTETEAYYKAEVEVQKLRKRIVDEFVIQESRRSLEMLLAHIDAELALAKDEEEVAAKTCIRDWLRSHIEPVMVRDETGE